MTLYPGPPWRFLPTPAVLSLPSSDRSFSPGVRMRAVGLCNTLGRTATIFMPFLAVFLFRMHGVKGVLILMIGSRLADPGCSFLWHRTPDAPPRGNSITAELLTWLVGNLSAFCFKTGGCDQILHFKPGAREQRVCFVECLTK